MARKKRLYVIYNGIGEQVTLFPKESVAAAWHQLARSPTQSVDEICQYYEPLGCACWEVETVIVQKRKVRAKFPKAEQGVRE